MSDIISRLTLQRPVSLQSSVSSDTLETELLPKSREKVGFVRQYTLVTLTLMGFGQIIGTGVYSLTGPAAHLTGSSVALCYAFTGCVALLTATIYAEFASLVPKSGSSYLYTYCILGEGPAWIVAHNQIFGQICSNSLVARGLSSYAGKLAASLGFNVAWLFKYQWGNFEISFFSMITLVIVTCVHNSGTKASGHVNSAINIVKLLTLAVMIVAAFANFDSKYLTPFLAKEDPAYGFLEASTILYFCFTGWEAVTTMSEEAVDPVLDIPRAIIFAEVASTAIYVLVALGCNGLADLSQSEDGGHTAISDAFENVGLKWMATVIQVIAMLGMFCNLLSTAIALSRFLYNTAKDGLHFPILARMSSSTQVPVISAALACIPQCVLAGMFDIRILAKVTTACLLITYSMIDSSVLLHRFREVGNPR